MITAILAQSKDGIIGVLGPDGPTLPWSLPPDLRRFRVLTTGHAVVMGRTTYESIGRPLPNRRNIVVSRNAEARRQLDASGPEWAHRPDEALAMALTLDPAPFIIGGAQIYAALWRWVDQIELTCVDVLVGLGLVLDWDRSAFRLVEQSEAQEYAGLSFRFETYVRTTRERKRHG